MTGLFASLAAERLTAARAVPMAERAAYIERLAQGSGYAPWPYGMPTSINPLVVIVGVSPGNSPAAAEDPLLSRESYPVPTFGEQHPGLRYPDTNSYWSKARELAVELAGIWAPSLSTDDRLALTGHLNLGTGSFGRAGPEAVEEPVVRWVSRLLHRDLAPKVVVGFGLVGVLLSPQARAVRDAWDAGGLKLDWDRPEFESGTAGANRYTFRIWRALRTDGEFLHVVIFPNHPSRVPFAGRGGPGSRWHEASGVLAELLRGRLSG